MLDFGMIFLIATHGWLNGKTLKNELFASFDLFVLCAVLLLPTEWMLLLLLCCSYFSHGRVLVVLGMHRDHDQEMNGVMIRGRAHEPSRPRKTSAPLLLTAAPIGADGSSWDGRPRTKTFHLE